MINNNTMVEKENWNELVKADKNSTVFSFYEWCSILEDIQKQKCIGIKNGDTLLPLSLVKSAIFGNRLISVPFADYGGTITKNFNEDEFVGIIEKTKELADSLNVDYVEIRAPNQNFENFLLKEKFEKRVDYYTFKIPIDRSEEELKKFIGKNRRYEIRKSQIKGVEFRVADSIEDLKFFYELYLKTMKKIGSPPQSLIYFESLWKQFFPNRITVPFAIYKQNVIASGIFLHYNGLVHHLYSCSLEKYFGLGANEFILWNMMLNGKKMGYKLLDMGRTRKNSGVWNYKQKWNGILVEMPYYYYFVNKKLNQRDEERFNKVSVLWRRYMPNYLAKIIGPWIIKQIG
jgi:hypothetical protein